MNARKLAAVAGFALGLAAVAGPAQSVLWSFEDDDIDFILRGGVPIQAGNLQVGDVFASVIEIPQFTRGGVNGIPAGQELTGLAAVQLAAIIGGGGAGTQYIFAPVANFNAVFGTAIPGCGAGGGCAIATWLNGAPGAGTDIDLELNRTINPATNCVSFANCVDQANNGSLFQVDGFLGDPDEFWVATQILAGGGNIATVLATNNNTLVAGINLGLSNIFNAQGAVGYISSVTGLPCNNAVDANCVQFSGSATLTGGQGLSNGAVAHSDFDGQKNVPEPGTLALLSLALLGLGARLPRRRA